MCSSRGLAAFSLVLSLLAGCDAFDNDAFNRLRAELQDAGQEPPARPMDAGMDGGVPDAAMDAGPVDSGPPPDDMDAGTPEPLMCRGGICWWSGENAEGCFTAGRPTLDDRPVSDSDRELPPIYFGVSQLRLGNFLPDGFEDIELPADNEELGPWATFGLDLDGVCSNSFTCDAPPGEVACRSPAVELPFDGFDCRDNTFARLQPVAAMVPQVGEQFGLAEDVFNCSLWRGEYTVITKLTGYNGEPNDDQVRLDFYTSTGIQDVDDRQGWTCPQENFDERYPLWRASERWLINEADLAEPMEVEGQLPASTTPVPDAYVRDGYVVAMLPPNMVFRMAGDNARYPGFRLVLQNGIWLGRLEKKQDTTWRVRDGLLAGAVTKDDLLRAFREIGLCPQGDMEPFYMAVETYVVENADIMADGTVDSDAECDSMSVGIYLHADPVTPGALTNVSVPVECSLDGDGGV